MTWAGAGVAINMCDSNFRRSLLEQRFRVWLSGSISEYNVALTPISLILTPAPAAGAAAAERGAAASSCCRICPRPPSTEVEVFGRDLLSCRPAHGIPIETKVVTE